MLEGVRMDLKNVRERLLTLAKHNRRNLVNQARAFSCKATILYDIIITKGVL